MDKFYFKQIEDNYCPFQFNKIISINVGNLVNMPLEWLRIIKFHFETYNESAFNNSGLCLPLYDEDYSVIFCFRYEAILYRPDRNKIFSSIDDISNIEFAKLIINALLKFKPQWINFLTEKNQNISNKIDEFNQLVYKIMGKQDE